ncbi:P-loop containing nucleoside triphosphate hydrolase protein [Mycena sp. CBHHK59/15]|nr:P-loop containing nucleoside triphosphate hydrolase protein [Mycena sp. CBHHK59/15]
MRRKVIMHVGPTNSGKTHHALRALASAQVGVYAGPLRLLAYEIWERLNLGQIVPLGATDEEIAEAAKIGPSVDSPFARNCNMLTGEEQKIVSPSARLHSCTVEMLSLEMKFKVAVIDEIQMISDRERGPGWTRAVLGLCAEELHLCGEETAVPLIEKMLRETGDELVVKRYNRLTPLEVEEESLEGDLSRVRKGDCIVAFSRSAIFSLKSTVESKTNLKCAVVYGRLPPEVRSEQAALFNDPDSGYDVLIGSDAIGMGLNLKIRRVIFEAVAKFDGQGLKTLSVSQMKQIAGRAGRFGMQGLDEKPGGFVTTLKAQDLPILRKTLPLVIPPLEYARISNDRPVFANLASVLPANASTETVFLAHMHAGRLPSYCRPSFPNMLETICQYLDEQGEFTLEDRILFTQAPFPWRDNRGLHAITAFVTSYWHNMHVDVMTSLERLPYLRLLDEAETAMRAAGMKGAKAFNVRQNLLQLELFHKILVVYLWLSFRNPVSYSSYGPATDLKERLEVVLHWCLQEVTKYRAGDKPTTTLKKAPIEYKTRRQVYVERQMEVD